MAYTTVIGAMVVLAAEGLDRVSRLMGWPRRWVWVSAIVLVLVLSWQAVSFRTEIAGGLDPNHSPAFGHRWQIGLIASWIAASGILITRLIVGFALARLRLRALLVASVDGVELRIADDASASPGASASPSASAAADPGRIATDRMRPSGQHAMGPALVGLVRPVIVLPRWVLALPRRDRSLILLHEQEHERAGDQWLRHGAALIVALLPWHAPLWHIVRRLRRAIEVDCDARVLERRGDIARYGSVLLDSAERSGRMVAHAMTPLHGKAGELAYRIRAMTTGCPNNPVRRAIAPAVMAAAIVSGMTLVRRPAPIIIAVAPASRAMAPSVNDEKNVRTVAVSRAGALTQMSGPPLAAHDAAAIANVRGPAVVRFIPDPDRPSVLVAIIRYQHL